MTDYNKLNEAISLSQLKSAIQLLQAKSDTKEYTMWMTSALGSYLQMLQTEYNYSPIFPLELLPISKSDIKKWGGDYAAIMVKKEGELKQYQQDAALSFTRFQSITPKQWVAIREYLVPDLVIYNAEVRDKGLSNVDIPSEFKLIIDSYRNDYALEVTELHTYLKSLRKPPLGCIIPALFLSVVLAVTWFYFF